MKLNENIKIMRIKKGMTLEELGKRISVSKQTVQRYESGQIPNIPYDKIELLAKVFGCSRSYLMGWEDNLNKENSDLIPDILSDDDLINHIKKLMCLNPEHRQAIYDNTIYWYEKEGH